MKLYSEWDTVFEYKIVLVRQSPMEVNSRVKEWRQALADKGSRISRDNKYMSGDKVGEYERPEYLGYVLLKDDELEEDIDKT